MTSERPEDNELYAGRWVAKIGNRIIGQGGTPKQVLKAAKTAYFKETPIIEYISSKTVLNFPPLVSQIRSIVPSEISLYLVGGAVRDALLGKEIHDLDFVVPRDSLLVGRLVANELGGAFYPLDKERQTARVILTKPPYRQFLLDFSLQRGPDLETDLAARDFTVNAIAIDLSKPNELLDPLGGAADLIAKRLHICSTDAFYDDPVRILRGLRLAAEFKLKATSETRKRMRLAVKKLPEVSAERRRDEFFRILAGNSPVLVMRALDIFGVLEMMIPEINALKNIPQSSPHAMDVFNHTLDTMHQLEMVLDILDPTYDLEASPNLWFGLLSSKLGRYRVGISEHISQIVTYDRNVRGLLFFAALYHDAGKAQTKHETESGRIRFIGHEKMGAELVALRGQNMNLSTSEIKRLATIVENHMRPLLLSAKNQEISPRVIYRFFKDTGQAGIDICLLALADAMSTYGLALNQHTWLRHLDVSRSFLQAWWESPNSLINPPVLINGDDLIARLNLKPGPIIGEILERIREEQVSGKIKTHGGALKFARSIVKSSGID